MPKNAVSFAVRVVIFLNKALRLRLVKQIHEGEETWKIVSSPDCLSAFIDKSGVGNAGDDRGDAGLESGIEDKAFVGITVAKHPEE